MLGFDALQMDNFSAEDNMCMPHSDTDAYNQFTGRDLSIGRILFRSSLQSSAHKEINSD